MAMFSRIGRQWSITFKLIIALLFVSLLPMALATYVNLQNSLQTVVLSEQTNLRLLANSITGRLDQLIGGVQRVTRLIAKDGFVIRSISPRGDADSRESATQLLKRIQEDSLDIDHVYVMDSNGVFVCSTNFEVIGKNYSYREYYKAAIQGNDYVSDLLVGSVSGGMGVYFSSPVHDEKTDSVIGVVVIKLGGEKIYNILNQVSELGGPHRAFLIDSDGIVIAHPETRMLYKSLTTLPLSKIQAVQSGNRFPVKTIESLDIPQVAEAMVSAKHPGYLRFLAPYTQTATVLGYAPLKHHSWVVGVSETEGEFLRPINRLFWKMAAGFLITGVFVILLAIFFGRTLTRPIRTLTEVTSALSKTKDPTEPSTNIASLKHGVTGFALSDYLQEKLLHMAKVNRDEIGQLALTFNEMLVTLGVYIENLKSVTAAKERIESEMRIAAGIQESFLPAPFGLRPGTNVDLHAAIYPAKQVGGDLYDFFFIDKNHLFFAVGDVSDKGMPAALFMGVSLALLRNIVSLTRSPSQILTDLNNALCRKNDAYQFVTVFCGIFNTQTGELQYSHGGHNPPYHYRMANQSVHGLLPVSGTALGVFEESQYETKAMTLADGDVFFVYSDGITEAMNLDRHLYGEPRLEDCLKRTQPTDTAEQISARVLSDISAYVDTAPQSDDITILCLRFCKG